MERRTRGNRRESVARALAVTILFGVCYATDVADAGAGGQEVDWMIIPGERIGPVTAESSAAALRATLGGELVVDRRIGLGEGEIEAGTLVYPDDATATLAILWHDVERRERPRRVIVCYDPDRWMRDDHECRWRTANGISMGVRLSALESLNGRPFTLSGFEWDYSGTVLSWEGGQLERLLNAGGWRAWLRLLPRSDDDGNLLPPVDYDELRPVLGDRAVPSTHPVMQRLDPSVYSMGFQIDR